eukprot:2057885-Prymnesium_polylepis.1
MGDAPHRPGPPPGRRLEIIMRVPRGGHGGRAAYRYREKTRWEQKHLPLGSRLFRFRRGPALGTWRSE